MIFAVFISLLVVELWCSANFKAMWDILHVKLTLWPECGARWKVSVRNSFWGACWTLYPDDWGQRSYIHPSFSYTPYPFKGHRRLELILPDIEVQPGQVTSWSQGWHIETNGHSCSPWHLQAGVPGGNPHRQGETTTQKDCVEFIWQVRTSLLAVRQQC